MISRQAGAGENYDIRPNQVLTYTSYSVFNVHISILLGVFWMIFRLILSIIFFSVSAGFAAENYRLPFCIPMISMRGLSRSANMTALVV